MEHFQYAHVDDSPGSSYNVRVGGGTRLGRIDESLRAHRRAMPHGMCAGVGIGGHATLGGIGPASRMWGMTLDGVEEMEVVTANGTIVRASTKENPDLFFAMRGAGPGFGIVTEFVMRTHPAPPAVLHFTRDFAYGHPKEVVDAFYDWQAVVADPGLDRRLGTEILLTPRGARVTSTWYGNETDLRQTGILDRLSAGGGGSGGSVTLRRETWEGSLALLAAEESTHRPEKPGRLLSRSRGLGRRDLLSRAHVAALFDTLERLRHAASGPWAVKFQAVGGAVSTGAAAAVSTTAYAHRDDVVLYHSFAADASDKGVRDLLDGFHRALLNMAPGAEGTYPGFADPELRDPRRSYWGPNLAALEEIKGRWDPEDVFHNPQSVVPPSPRA
ncbi:putative FAD-linked oxidoreductase YgaK [Colletotrichum tanaceti]|nr:putative FAD-linked oxidoreductase YgaK [Colletotrichum tanaceti]